jgi:hypothetical protein
MKLTLQVAKTEATLGCRVRVNKWGDNIRELMKYNGIYLVFRDVSHSGFWAGAVFVLALITAPTSVPSLSILCF